MTRNRSRSSTRSPLFKLPVQQEVQEEIEFHLEMRVHQYMDEGMNEDEARTRARQRLGDLTIVEQDCRRVARQRDRRFRSSDLLSELRMDLLYAVRQLGRNPGFSATILTVLALGLGANIAVFSLVSAVLLKPLPFGDPSELVSVWEEQISRGATKNVANPANYLLFKENSTTLESLAAFVTVDANLTGNDSPAQRARLRVVTGDYFTALGRPAMLGRTLEPGDADGEPVTVLGHSLFRDRFGGRDDVVGSLIELNGTATRVVGVMPPGFELDMGPGVGPYGKPADLYAPLPVTPEWESAPGRWLMIIGRRRAGVTMEQVSSEMELLSERMLEAHPEMNANWTAAAYSLEDHVHESERAPLGALLAAVGLVLLIVCINVASLLTARAATRSSEVAIRGALGAGRGRLARQLLNEGLLLSTIATVLGLGLAWWLTLALRATLPPELLASPTLDSRVLAFTVLLLVLSTLVFGLVPAVHTLRRSHVSLLRFGVSTGPAGTRLRSGLVFAEIALAVVSLVGAGLMLRSVFEQLQIDTGFDQRGVLSFRIAPTRGTPRADTDALYTRLFERLQAMPGVVSVGAVTHVPMTSVGAATSYFPLDREEPEEGQAPAATIRVVRGDYFKTLAIPLLEGRPFDASDTEQSEQPSIIINQTLADKQWPGESAIGKQLEVAWGDLGGRTIVGVVADVLVVDPSTPKRETIYFPQAQEWESTLSVLVKTSDDPRSLATSVRSLVAELDPGLPVYDVQTMANVVSDSMKRDRALALVLLVLAVAALILAALGVYGVTSYSVAQRHREFGLRVALGASPGEIEGLVLRRMGLLTLTAVAAGAALALLLAPLAKSLLFGVGPRDPLTVGGVVLLLGISGLAAAFAPARRAARIQPARALRDE